MKKETPSRTHQREKAQAMKEAVMRLLDCDELQYNRLQFEEGVKYLQTYLNGDSASVAMMEQSRTFWNWWRNHWSNRDELFMTLHEQNPICRTEIARQLYMQYNRGRMLAKSIHPNAIVLNESYAVMIGELIEEQR